MKSARNQNRIRMMHAIGIHRLARTTCLVLSTVVIAGCASHSGSKTHVSTGHPDSTAASENPEEPQLMFVQVAEDCRVDASKKKLRLVKVDPQSLYFSDRPVRLAGHLKMNDYLQEWTAAAGTNNFGADPPNATLSVYEPGQPDSTIVVIEITDPVVDGDDLVYGYKVIEGKMPSAGGSTALFIDWIGVGGGVGRGFHGIGVGRRGPGWRGWRR